MANYYTVDNVANFVANKRLDGVYTDCRVTGLKKLEFFESQQLQGYTIMFTLSLKDSNKRYKGKRLKVLTNWHWFDYNELDFSCDDLTDWFDVVLGI